MMHLLMRTRQIKRLVAAGRIFFWQQLRSLEFYVPSLYEVTYKEDGTIKSFQPKYENVPEKVEKQLVIDMDKDYNKLEAPVVPHIKATQDRVTLEIQRGCIRGLPFLSGRHDLPSYKRT